MNAELLYTSAPQGLKQGSRGFCTVLSTQGMPINLASKLESLSGYRHVYPSGTPEDSQNPVAYSHLKFSVGGRSVSVLSRVAAYGLDYSQRTNKIAHHVVLDDPMPPCGPAALLLAPGFMRDSWDGQCQTVIAPAIPDINVQPNRCQQWESLTGDAGWGGRIAEAWLDRKGKPIFVIFSIEQYGLLLGLMAESISLLPPSKRWQATFGTYITNLPPDVDCKVRCVIAGSDEARMASARGEVIDLSRPNSLGVFPPSEGVRAAREGIVIGTANKDTVSNSLPIPVAGVPDSTTLPPVDSLMIDDEDDADLQIAGSTQSTAPRLPMDVSGALPPAHPGKRKPPAKSRAISGQKKTLILATSVLVLLILVIGTTFFLLKANPFAELQADLRSEAETQPAPAMTEPAASEEPKRDEANDEMENDERKPPDEIKPKPEEVQSPPPNPPNASPSNGPSQPQSPSFKIEDFTINFGQAFYLPYGKDFKKSLPIKVGLPGAKLNATIVAGETNRSAEAEAFLKNLKSENSVEWKWEFQVEKEWKPIPSPDLEIDGTSCTLTVNESYPPGAKIRGIAFVKIESNDPNPLVLTVEAPANIDEYRVMSIRKADLFKPESQTGNTILNLSIDDITDSNYRLEWKVKSNFQNAAVLSQLENGSIKLNETAHARIKKLLTNVKITKDLLKKLNRHRQRLIEFLTDSINYAGRPTAFLETIRITLEDGGKLDGDLKWNTPWSPNDFTNIFKSNFEEREIDYNGDRKKASDLAQKLGPQRQVFAKHSPQYVQQLKGQKYHDYELWEWNRFDLLWNESFRKNATPKSDYEDMIKAYGEFRTTIDQMDELLDLECVVCFRLSDKSSPLDTESLRRAEIDTTENFGLWLKLKFLDHGNQSSKQNNIGDEKKPASKALRASPKAISPDTGAPNPL